MDRVDMQDSMMKILKALLYLICARRSRRVLKTWSSKIKREMELFAKIIFKCYLSLVKELMEKSYW